MVKDRKNINGRTRRSGDNEIEYDLATEKSCSSQRWYVNGFRCSHATAASLQLGESSLNTSTNTSRPDGYTDDDTILPPRLLNTAGDETKKSLRLADSHALRLREID
ncbi:uncharacterized protein LOC113314346 [Papaver somniferum]|uniref:uncharacterized protein LOC113314346 n=1 Tax=Papaver somniferum TaxID=3469 RepID=UPI000E703A78|nr:uncharacterized protein LOC113314346 [Papaver somniferum]XP_026418927.1 uncharacterized protein LOC113314346 [Papaver somniferum]